MGSRIGEAVGRREDARLLTGNGRFAADHEVPRALAARIVRSPLASGRLLSVDTAAAAAAPGVVAVLTAAELPGDPRIPVRLPVQGIDLGDHLQPVLARETVRYVGEPVAVVIAADEYLAEDAAELVAVSIEPTPVTLSAAADDVEPVADFTLGYGDVVAAFAAADEIVTLDVHIGRHTAVPMEPRSLVVITDPDGTLSIYGSTKVPGFNQRVLADLLGIDSYDIHIHSVDAGGGFGVRGEFYPEDFLIPWAARITGRPVRWTEDRAEHLVAVNHSREQHHHLELALAADGEILGMRAQVRHDNGAYVRTHGIIVPELTVAMLPGPYRIPTYEGRAQVMLTNKTPAGTYRAPGRFEGTASREQLLDLAAERLGMSRVAIRERNLLESSELPLDRQMSTLGTSVVLDAGDYPGLMARALARAHELGWPERVTAARAQGRRVGLGIANFLEKSGLGPYDTADVEVTRTGRILLCSGATSLGQGIETALSQIVAEAFAVDVSRIDVITGDTRRQPYGTGSWASRSTVVAGNAAWGAAVKLRQRIVELAARVIEVDADELEVRDAAVHVRGVPTATVTLAELWQAAQPNSRYLQPGEPVGLAARHQFSIDHMTYPYGTHVCLAEVDPGTGGVSVLEYLVAYEVGRAVNPPMVDGQLRGGIAQGIGGALLEEFQFDETGQPQSATFMDYLLPTAMEVPALHTVISEESPAPDNELGVRGAGEGGLTAAGAAIASAVTDALGTAGITALPLSPSRVRRLLERGVATG